MASMDRSVKKDKNQNIQVFVRLRPLNSRERAINSRGAVEVINNREVVVRQLYQASHSKKFTFDRAFGPNAEQVEVYKEVVSPLIAEVLAGYNCTVFAYGQTGTGKTHTMVGENSGEGTTWQNDPLAGIIPRALSQLFDELRISNTEYNVRVSYLELYNEELCDLLSPSWDTSKLRIYEDVNRKGSTIVNGLEEITVYNKNEVYEIMARGQERKKVASTLMNSQSSRSHTVFTIVVHIKENSNKGEELVKIGKLNLVDLAGSENISKAGTDNPSKKERARECVNINQSLLTLGRVITALVEKHPHIPYRESKLTRILQESLGGRTKTSIIATISPGSKDLEETMSTLEYANRAKNIQNKPEVNQKLTKQAILKEYAEEVDKLKRELMAAREKNGVYLPTETYEEMMIKHDDQRREIQELLLKKRAMEEERERMESVFRDLESQHSRTANELSSTRNQLDQYVSVLEVTAQECSEQRHLVSAHARTERQLAAAARDLLAAADTAAGHAAALHDTVDRRKSIENTNQESVSAYRNASTAQRDLMLGQIDALTDTYTHCRNQLQHNIDNHTKDTSMTEELNIQDLKLLAANLASVMNEIIAFQKESDLQVSESSSSCKSELSSGSTQRLQALQQALAGLGPSAAERLARAAAAHPAAALKRDTARWLSDATVRVSNLQQSHNSFTQCARKLEETRAASARRRHNAHLQHIKQGEERMASLIQQVEKDKQTFEERMSQQIALIESERDQTERRLEEISRNVETVRSAVHSSATNHIAELRTQWQQYQDNTSRYIAAAALQADEARAHLTTATTHVGETVAETTEAVKHVDEYDKEFAEGKSAIEAEIHAFSDSVVQIVTHTNDQLLAELDETKTIIEQKVAEVQEQDSALTKQLLDNAGCLVDRVAHTASNALAVVASKAQDIASSSQSSISGVVSRCSALGSSALAAQAAQSGALSRATAALAEAGAGLRQQLAAHADAEAKYLMHEYRVYTPTGTTPARHSYRYPRQLPATSPHDRILQRFRQRPRLQQHPHPQPNPHPDSPDSDCIIVPEYEAQNGHDSDEASESSVSEMSEDSGVVQQ